MSKRTTKKTPENTSERLFGVREPWGVWAPVTTRGRGPGPRYSRAVYNPRHVRAAAAPVGSRQSRGRRRRLFHLCLLTQDQL
ncbi:hypothetical protein MTO96_007280 [Rhipicephalus appendiculatus]